MPDEEVALRKELVPQVLLHMPQLERLTQGNIRLVLTGPDGVVRLSTQDAVVLRYLAERASP